MTAENTYERARRLLKEYRQDIDARLNAAAAARAAEGCITIPYLCRVAEAPDQIPEETRTHIQHCGRCTDLYQGVLEGFPHLSRPDWLPTAPSQATQTVAVPGLPALRQTTALVLVKDQERMDREWADMVGPYLSYLRGVLNHLPKHCRYWFWLYSGYPIPPSSEPDGSAAPFDKGQHHGH